MSTPIKDITLICAICVSAIYIACACRYPKEKLLHPCGPPQKCVADVGSDFNPEPGYVQTSKEERVRLIIVNMKDASKLVKKIQRVIKKELTKKSSRFAQTLVGSKRNITGLTLPSNSSSMFRAFPQNIKLDYTSVSKIWLVLRRFRKRAGGKKVDRRWRRRISKLKKKNLEILCRIKEVIEMEKSELPPVASLPVIILRRGNPFRRQIDEYRILERIKIDLRKMIRLYKRYLGHFGKRSTKC